MLINLDLNKIHPTKQTLMIYFSILAKGFFDVDFYFLLALNIKFLCYGSYTTHKILQHHTTTHKQKT